jgi:signal transduction histidine kinase
MNLLSRRGPARRWVERWERLDRPRRSVRMRLTLLYSGLFLLSGAGLVIVTYFLIAHRLPVPMNVSKHIEGTGSSSSAGGLTFQSGGITSACTPNPALAAPEQLTQCAGAAQVALASQRTAELNDLLIKSGIALAIMAVLSIGLGWLVAGRVLRPLRVITTTARRMSANSLHERLALAGPHDELKELGDTFDGLLARLEASFSAQRQFVANASHELRTPLARQRTLVEVALADPEPTVDSLTDTCTRVLAAGEQQERLIEALLTLARSQRGLDVRQPIELATVAGAAMRSRQAEADAQGITLSAELGPGPIMGDPRLAERLVVNLVDNALRHNVPGGWVHVFTGLHDGEAVLAVVNSGEPVAPEVVGRLFEPFERLDAGRVAGRDGLGLGLSIVRAIAEAHHAGLSVCSLPEGGLDLQVRFPYQPPAPAPGPSC